jgi:hypothetical protein
MQQMLLKKISQQAKVFPKKSFIALFMCCVPLKMNLVNQHLSGRKNGEVPE